MALGSTTAQVCCELAGLFNLALIEDCKGGRNCETQLTSLFKRTSLAEEICSRADLLPFCAIVQCDFQVRESPTLLLLTCQLQWEEDATFNIQIWGSYEGIKIIKLFQR